MLTFTTFNLKKTSLVTVLQKTCFIQKRFMKRASDEVGKKVEWPTQRWFSSLVNRGSSSRSGSSATLSQMGATRRQQDVADYRRASTPIGIQVRNASSRAELRQFQSENNVELVHVDEPTKKGIHEKILVIDVGNPTNPKNYLLTKCIKYWDSFTSSFRHSDFAAGCPISDTCGATSENLPKSASF